MVTILMLTSHTNAQTRLSVNVLLQKEMLTTNSDSTEFEVKIY